MDKYTVAVESQRRDSGEVRRIVLFTAPLQGHITPMLLLANALHSKGFSISILLPNFNSPDPSHFPDFTFHFFDISLSKSDSHSPQMVSILNSKCSAPFKNCLSNVLIKARSRKEEVCCLISDPLLIFVDGVAREFKLPRIALRSSGASAFVVFNALPRLRDLGYFPD